MLGFHCSWAIFQPGIIQLQWSQSRWHWYPKISLKLVSNFKHQTWGSETTAGVRTKLFSSFSISHIGLVMSGLITWVGVNEGPF